jgi:hypothetical protein
MINILMNNVSEVLHIKKNILNLEIDVIFFGLS